MKKKAEYLKGVEDYQKVHADAPLLEIVRMAILQTYVQYQGWGRWLCCCGGKLSAMRIYMRDHLLRDPHTTIDALLDAWNQYVGHNKSGILTPSFMEMCQAVETTIQMYQQPSAVPQCVYVFNADHLTGNLFERAAPITGMNSY